MDYPHCQRSRVNPEEQLRQTGQVWCIKITWWEGNAAWKATAAGSKARTARSHSRMMCTASPHGIMPGKVSSTIAICLALAGREPQPGKPPTLHIHFAAPPCPPPLNLQKGTSAVALTPSGRSSLGHVSPSRLSSQGMGEHTLRNRAGPAEQNFCSIKCL